MDKAAIIYLVKFAFVVGTALLPLVVVFMPLHRMRKTFDHVAHLEGAEAPVALFVLAKVVALVVSALIAWLGYTILL